MKHTGGLDGGCWTALTLASELVAFTRWENWTMESHSVFHWNGTEINMDAVSLANSEEQKPSHIFLRSRDACDIV